jgi:hypothetical protein
MSIRMRRRDDWKRPVLMLVLVCQTLDPGFHSYPFVALPPSYLFVMFLPFRSLSFYSLYLTVFELGCV